MDAPESDVFLETDRCSSPDYLTAGNLTEASGRNSDTEDDSYDQYRTPTSSLYHDTNYAKCLNEIITKSNEGITNLKAGIPKHLNGSFEMLPYVYESKESKEENTYYEIFPSLDGTFSPEPEGDSSNESWCEEAKFKEYYDNFTMDIDYPKFKEEPTDDVLVDNPWDEPLKKFIEDLPLFRDHLYKRVDSNPEVIESNFHAQMEWKVDWDASNSDEERELANKDTSEYEDEELWPGPANNDDKNLICYYCNYTTSQQRYLNYHINTKHIVRQYSCCRCEFNTSDRESLHKHIESVHVVKCQYCDFKTILKEHLDHHLLKTHCTRELWECLMCNYMTPKEHKLKHHIEVAHPHSKGRRSQFKKLQCYSCPYSSTSKKDLAIHLKTAHMKPKVDRCVICDYRPRNWKDHEEHNEKYHRNLKL